MLSSQIAALGGMHNAHLHLDRANTLSDGHVDHGRLQVLENSHISLQKKHALIRTVHDGKAYDSSELERRVRETIDVMVACGTRRADTMVDVTDDRVNTLALRLLMDIAKDMANQIDVQCAAYTPLGFGSDNVADMCSPSTTANLIEEVFTLSSAIRYFKIEILAKFAAGQKLTDDERTVIREPRENNDVEMARLIKGAYILN